MNAVQVVGGSNPLAPTKFLSCSARYNGRDFHTKRAYYYFTITSKLQTGGENITKDLGDRRDHIHTLQYDPWTVSQLTLALPDTELRPYGTVFGSNH